jgi:Serine dehydrogenase proteinase
MLERSDLKPAVKQHCLIRVLTRYYAAVAEAATRYLLAWLDSSRSIDPTALTPVRREIEDQVTEPREDVAIDVWLESPGGDAHSAFKLALMLRDAASHVRVVVPDYAKSAATLLALAGDELYMAPGAELGPLDAQLPEEGSLMGQISALNIARAADDVARNAVDIALQGGAEVINMTRLSRADTMDVMFRFSASFSEPLMRQLDPRVVHDAKQLLKVTVEYAKRLLTMTQCRDAERIARQMVEDYPTHGFVIDQAEASRIGLPVQPFRDYEFVAAATGLHRATEDAGGMIEFGRIEEYLPVEEKSGGEADHVNQLSDPLQNGEGAPSTVASDDDAPAGHPATV